MTLVAGVDSSTQSCKVVVRDAESGELIRSGRAPHPQGTEVDPERWWLALNEAADAAGGLADVAALSVAAQQHGMVTLAESGEVVRPALLWNDTRSAPQADQLVAEHGGPGAWAAAVSSVPVASFTITKLAWLAQNERGNADRTAAVCLPHDWLTWRLAGFGPAAPELAALRTDRGDASGTGYFSPTTGEYRRDLLTAALGHDAALPEVLPPAAAAGSAVAASEPRGVAPGAMLGPGTGDNAAAALGLGAGPGDVVVSIGTSGVVSAVTEVPANDPTGTVAGFADATGRFLPLVCTLNAARVLGSVAAILRVDLDELARLALTARPGCEGVVLVPYFEGERTPNRPDSTAAFHGLTLTNTTPPNLARAAFEGVLCGLADGIDALVASCRGNLTMRRVILIGGATSSAALRQVAPAVFGCPVEVPAPSEYVADGAARQAAWVLSGAPQPPAWAAGSATLFDAEAAPTIRERYAQARDLTIPR